MTDQSQECLRIQTLFLYRHLYRVRFRYVFKDISWKRYRYRKKKSIFNIHDKGVNWIFQLRVGRSPLKSHKSSHKFLGIKRRTDDHRLILSFTFCDVLKTFFKQKILTKGVFYTSIMGFTIPKRVI